MQGEIDGFAAGWLESCSVVEACGEDVLDGDVRLALRSDADGCELSVDGVEAVPREAFVDTDGLQGCYWNGDGDVVELNKCGRLARGGYDLTDSILTLAFCWLKPMLAALATIAGTAKIVTNFMMEMETKKRKWV